MRYAITFAIVSVLITLFALANMPPSPTSQTPSCKNDWTLCTDNSDLANNWRGGWRVGWSSAGSVCIHAAEEKARYGKPKFPWVFPFATFFEGDDYVKTGKAIAIEKDAQFQNQYGAMEHMEVECTFDLHTKKVLNVIVSSTR